MKDERWEMRKKDDEKRKRGNEISFLNTFDSIKSKRVSRVSPCLPLQSSVP